LFWYNLTSIFSLPIILKIKTMSIQNAQEGAEVVTDGESVEKTLSIIELISSGGVAGQVIIAVLFLLLVSAIYIYFERIFAIKAASKVDANFMNQIKDHVSNGKIDSAQMLCAQQNSPVSRLIGKGISRIGKPLADINTAIENAGRLEIYGLEKNVSILATISGAAPMIGFLGTVIGMILAIFELANAGGTIQMDVLASGLYTAMTTTVAGLIVGIVAYMAYNHLVVRTDKVVYQMEANSLEFLDHLNEPT
jgi:biopolymer transport protein ExbB